MTAAELETMLSRLGLMVRKVTDTRSNSGVSPAQCLADSITLFYEGVAERDDEPTFPGFDDDPEIRRASILSRPTKPYIFGDKCQARREGDEMTCRCGIRWDAAEASPCPRSAHT